MSEQEIAPAKINLFLHVGPLRGDGYHALESLFVFTEDGDRLYAEEASGIDLEIAGPFAAALAASAPCDNLVWRAALALRETAGVGKGAVLRLEKRLPVAAGIGGGSSDAAAALRVLRRLWRVDIDEAALGRIAFNLGADVPACLRREPVFVSGAGERVRRGPNLPPLWACLANPGVETPTGAVFEAFDRRYPNPRVARPAPLVAAVGCSEFSDYLQRTRNDLEPIVCERAPSVAIVRDFIASCPGCLLARMSGSGATVFGLFASPEAARRAARRSTARGWWSIATRVERGGARAKGICSYE